MSAETHAELQQWFADNKSTPEAVLALKHLHSMPPEVVQHFLDAYPDKTADENERHLALLFALTQVAAQLDMMQLLMQSLKMVPIAPAPRVAHVDIAPEPFATIQDDTKPKK